MYRILVSDTGMFVVLGESDAPKICTSGEFYGWLVELSLVPGTSTVEVNNSIIYQ